MSQSKFTTANAKALEAVGRVNTGGRKIPLAVQIDTDNVLHITNADGFVIKVDVGFTQQQHVANVGCTLADGTIFLCEGRVDPVDGRLRLDATDQDNFSWFWVEVRRNFRRNNNN